MTSEIFRNYFINNFIPSLDEKRPVLVIYDGHVSHIDNQLIQAAIAANVHLLKLPAHTSHLLQPLDLSIFKSFKAIWDRKVTTWQRNHQSQRLPKTEFARLLASSWSEIDSDIVKNGFRKGGIFPFNRNVVSEDKYDVEALKRWKNHLKSLKTVTTTEKTATTIAKTATTTEKTATTTEKTATTTEKTATITNETAMTTDETATEIPIEESNFNDDVQTVEVEENNFENAFLKSIKPVAAAGRKIKRKSNSEAELLTKIKATPTTSDNQQETSIREEHHLSTTSENDTNEAGDNREIQNTNFDTEIECKRLDQILLNICKQHPSIKSGKRKRLVAGGETVTGRVISALEDPQPSVNKKILPRKKRIVKKGVLHSKGESNASDSDSDNISLRDSDQSFTLDSDAEDLVLEINKEDIRPGDWVLASYKLAKSEKHFIGQIVSSLSTGFEIKFVRKFKDVFVWPRVEDIDIVCLDAIITKLPQPKFT